MEEEEIKLLIAEFANDEKLIVAVSAMFAERKVFENMILEKQSIIQKLQDENAQLSNELFYFEMCDNFLEKRHKEYLERNGKSDANEVKNQCDNIMRNVKLWS